MFILDDNNYSDELLFYLNQMKNTRKDYLNFYNFILKLIKSIATTEDKNNQNLDKNILNVIILDFYLTEVSLRKYFN